MKKTKSKNKVSKNILFAIISFGIFLLLYSSILIKLNENNYICSLIGIIGFIILYSGILLLVKNKYNPKYLKNSINYIIFVSLLFILAIIAGILMQSNEMNQIMMKIMEELVDKTKNYGFIEMFWFILKNNSTVALISIFSGIILGIIPFMITLSNGYMLGWVCRKSSETIGILNLIKLMPHGIFEIPAIIISIALGIKIGFSVLSTKKAIIENIKNSFYILIFLIIPLLIIAAIIEASLIFFIK